MVSVYNYAGLQEDGMRVLTGGRLLEDFPAIGGPSKVTRILYASLISSPSHS